MFNAGNLPCICQYFTTDRNCKDTMALMNASGSEKSRSTYVRTVSTSAVSASQLAYLQSEVWSWKSRVVENSETITQLENIIKALVKEKYRLTEELEEIKDAYYQLNKQLCFERDLQAMDRKKLLEENFMYKKKLKEREQQLKTVVEKNVDLKVGLEEAKENIQNLAVLLSRMGPDHGETDVEGEGEEEEVEDDD